MTAGEKKSMEGKRHISDPRGLVPGKSGRQETAPRGLSDSRVSRDWWPTADPIPVYYEHAGTG